MFIAPNSLSNVNEAVTESRGGESISGNVLGSTPAAISNSIVGASGHLKQIIKIIYVLIH